MLASSPPPRCQLARSAPFAPGANWRVVPRPRRRGRTPGSSPPTPIPLCGASPRPDSPIAVHPRKSPSIATSQHPPRPPTGDLAPPPLRASPGPIPGPESRSWAPMPWVRPPRATPWVRCTKRVTHGARDSADEDHPAKGSPLRTSSTPPGSLSSYIISTE
ncbi:uncharacterized protein N7506_012354 [Penicillium brevicompactum]|uniref:uncharacterized protein n=1 Tax=Penicillium brevicompactum TaxID=5074 RepID=UPI0025416BB3|nr:uncharacterized protein N7506_012354 [Penicillium brevicompactum]KAJ5319650.1 hypothetical protein N7506_012354 [Penicillium brevicompactum]